MKLVPIKKTRKRKRSNRFTITIPVAGSTAKVAETSAPVALPLHKRIAKMIKKDLNPFKAKRRRRSRPLHMIDIGRAAA